VWHLRRNREKNRLDWANQNAVYTNPQTEAWVFERGRWLDVISSTLQLNICRLS
jgi:hypothetical protein